MSVFTRVGGFGFGGGAAKPDGNPSGLTATVLSDTSIKLDWTIGSTNQDGHNIYVSTNGTNFTLLDSVLGVTDTYSATGLVQGSVYYFKVAAYKGSKISEYSNTENATTTLAAPTALTSQFIVDTILGQLAWTDNSGGVASYEIYSNTNSEGDILITTTAVGATSYSDTSCKQNASVVYRIRAKIGGIYSDYVTASALVTPLCWKTNQSTRTNVVINALNIKVGKTVNIDWGDGTNADYTGNNTNITKTYDASAINVFNIKLSGDTNSITIFQHFNQIKSYGVVTNWVLPSTLITFVIYSTGLTGVVTNWVLPSTLTNFYINSTGLTGVVTNWVLPSTLLYFVIYSTGLTGVVTNWVLPSTLTNFIIYSTGLTGSLPQITAHATNGLSYQAQTASLSDSKATVFRKGMTVFNISNQNVPFLTDKIDKVLKALADWYQNNAPTANCTFTMNGVNMGIPTGGANNADLLRLAQYYANASKTATIIISS